MFLFGGRARKAKEVLASLLAPGFEGDFRRVLADNREYVDEPLARQALELGISEMKKGRLVEALRFLRVAAQASLITTDIQLRGNAHRWLAVAYTRRLESIKDDPGPTIREAVASLDVALSCMQAAGKARVLAQLWRDKGVAFQAAGLNQEAVEAYDEALKLMNRHGLPGDEPGLLSQCMHGRAACVTKEQKKMEASQVMRRNASELRKRGKTNLAMEADLERARGHRAGGRVDEAVKILRNAHRRLEGVAREVAVEVIAELAECLLELAGRSADDKLVLKAEAAARVEELAAMAPQVEGSSLADEAVRLAESLRSLDPDLAFDAEGIEAILREGPEPDATLAGYVDELEARMTRHMPKEDSVVLDAARAAQLTLHGWSRLESADEPSKIGLEAARTFLESVMVDPTKPETWAGYAEALMIAGRNEAGAFAPRLIFRALPHAMLAVQLGPWSRAARFVLGNAFARLRRYDLAGRELEELDKVAPLSYMALDLRISLAEEKGEAAEAIRLREQILRVAPSPATRRRHLYRLARDLAESGDLGRAERAYQALVKDFPEFAPGWHSFAVFLRGAGRMEEALKASDQAVARGRQREAQLMNRRLREELGR